MRDPLHVHLDSENVILRTVGDEEPEPATLSGHIILDLHERADIKDIVLAFTGSAHVTYHDAHGSYKSHSVDTPIYHHDQSFLPSFDGTSSSQSHHPALRGLRRPSHSQEHPGALGDHPALDSSSSHSHAGSSSTGHPHHPELHHSSSSLSTSSNSSKHHGSHHHHHHHAHTFNAGHHSFPFALTVPGALPASMKVNGATSLVTYQLKVTVIKAGVFGTKWSTKRTVNIIRGLLPEAAEYNQTMEIENTWPGKVMYNITLPHKAFCAGDSIPVALKFTPMAKGVRVTQLVTSIKEHVTVMDKQSHPHNSARDIASKKHNFHPRASLPSQPTLTPATASALAAAVQGVTGGSAPCRAMSIGGAHPISVPPSRSGSHENLAGMVNQASRLNLEDHPMLSASAAAALASNGNAHHPPSASGHASPAHGHGSSHHGHGTGHHGFTIGGATLGNSHASASSSANQSRIQSRTNSPERVYYGRNVNDPEYVGSVDEDGSEDVDVDAVVEIPIPVAACPTHSHEPLIITHKIKWSAFIKNLDGHTSELRCALPIHVLHPLLAEEARLASNGSRSLLFGPSGILVPAAEGIQQVDLPSYSDHVKDRVASIDTASMTSNTATSIVSNGGSGNASGSASAAFVRSPWATPMHSPPSGGITPGVGTTTGGSTSTGYFPESTTPEAAQQGRPINWADTELLNTLSMALPTQNSSGQNSSQGSSRHTSPANSRPGSRPGSRPTSRPSSRPTSRASSPVRGETTNISRSPETGLTMRPQSTTALAVLGHESGPSTASAPVHPIVPQRNSSFLGSMHLPKPLRPFTALNHSHSSSSNLLQKSPVAGSDEGRSHSTSSLSGFFGHHSLVSRPSFGSRQSQAHHDDHHQISHQSTPHHSPPHSRNGISMIPSSSHQAGGDVASQTIAALEAHQEQQMHGASKKGKGRAGFSFGGKGKGKHKGGMFSSMHDDDDHPGDDASSQHNSIEHEHDYDLDPDHHQEEEPVDETGSKYLSQVPSYEVARRGFLGGGVVPISVGLPSYDESETLSTPGTPISGSHAIPSRE